MRWLAVALWLVTAAAVVVEGFSVPAWCRHEVDGEGRQRVSCEAGGLLGPLDVAQVDAGTEVLDISAPAERPNALIIGPIFGALARLQELRLTRCAIPEVGAHSFWRLPALRLLDLRHNHISTVLDANFKGLPALRHLLLDDNRLARLSSGTFRELPALRRLSLATNRLDELVTRVFERLARLRHLDLSHNRLRHLHADVFADIQELQVFVCRGCALSRLDGAVYRLVPRLTTLDLGDNRLQPLAEDEFGALPELEALWLDGNALEAVPEPLLANASALRRLYLARNRLQRLPTVATTTLELLDVSDNALRGDLVLDGGGECALRTLLLTGNEGVAWEGAVRACRHLQRLGLAGLGLAALPAEVFARHADLQDLDLSGNVLERVPMAALAPAARLEALDLSGNRLAGVDAAGALRLALVRRVRLAANPWRCDACHVAPLLGAALPAGALAGAQCAAPGALLGRPLAALPPAALRRCGSAGALAGAGAEAGLGAVAAGAGLALLALTLGALLAAACYGRRHHAHYYTREERRDLHAPAPDHTDILFADGADITFKFPLGGSGLSLAKNPPSPST